MSAAALILAAAVSVAPGAEVAPEPVWHFFRSPSGVRACLRNAPDQTTLLCFRLNHDNAETCDLAGGLIECYSTKGI